jgi:isocitrate lyase
LNLRQLKKDWKTNPRWRGIVRPYAAEDVVRLRGTVEVEYSLARRGAEKLWKLLHSEPYIAALGALTGNQAIQQVRAGLNAIYLSGWQVAADANDACNMYPDQSLYPAGSVPTVIGRINRALMRADQIQHEQGKSDIDWMVPIVADAEAGFGGPLNAQQLTRAMIEEGAAGVHFEDQVSSFKKCGHMGGKVLLPTGRSIQTIVAGRMAADLLGVPTIIIARTDADSAALVTSDADPRDHAFLTGERTSEGFYRVRAGMDQAIARALAYAPYADMIWCETSEPNMPDAKKFATAIHKKFPGKLLAYNCSPSFNWNLKLSPREIAEFQKKFGAMGYKFQFVTLAGFHALNYSMFQLARGYRKYGMAAYADLQKQEFASEKHGYTATRHQEFVGAGYFDEMTAVITGGTSSTMALTGSTEEAQFSGKSKKKGATKRKTGMRKPVKS